MDLAENPDQDLVKLEDELKKRMVYDTSKSGHTEGAESYLIKIRRLDGFLDDGNYGSGSLTYINQIKDADEQKFENLKILLDNELGIEENKNEVVKMVAKLGNLKDYKTNHEDRLRRLIPPVPPADLTRFKKAKAFASAMIGSESKVATDQATKQAAYNTELEVYNKIHDEIKGKIGRLERIIKNIETLKPIYIKSTGGVKRKSRRNQKSKKSRKGKSRKNHGKSNHRR